MASSKNSSNKKKPTVSKSTKKKINKTVKKAIKKNKGLRVFLIILLIVAIAVVAVLYATGKLDGLLNNNHEHDPSSEPSTSEVISSEETSSNILSSDILTSETTSNEESSSIESEVTSSDSGAIEFEGVIYEDFQIHFLELGNWYTGDSTYVKYGDIDILIDAGSRKSSASTIKEYVDQFCTDGKLEYVIATHAHQDHIAGYVGNKSGSNYSGILYQYEIETIIDFVYSNSDSQIYQDYKTARDYAISNGATHYTAADCWNNKNGASRSFVLGENVSMDIVYNKFYFEETIDENDYSVCVMFNYYDHHALLTGDLEKEGEEALVDYYDGKTKETTLPEVDLFKAGHHGSKTSSTQDLLYLIKPKVITVCCCCGSDEYTSNKDTQFPTQQFINNIAPYTVNVYVTSISLNNETKEFASMNGNIIYSCNQEIFSIACSNNQTILKDTTWFKANRDTPFDWR